MTMTLAEFRDWYEEYRKRRPDQRDGQALYNAIWIVNPVMAKELILSQMDPFHDDSRVPAVWEWLEDHWDGTWEHGAS